MERIPEKPVDVKVMEQKAVFDEIMVWGHEAVPDAVDVYVKGVEEWIGFAEAVNLSDPCRCWCLDGRG